MASFDSVPTHANMHPIGTLTRAHLASWAVVNNGPPTRAVFEVSSTRFPVQKIWCLASVERLTTGTETNREDVPNDKNTMFSQ
jgi:hypothetical protein